MIRILKRQEFGLGIAKRVTIVQIDIVLAAFIGTDRKPLLWRRGALLNAPNFKDPVGVQCVYSATGLVTHHVDYLVML